MRIDRVVAFTVALALALAGTASAQNYSTDARKIAMGGNGGDSANIASGMVDKASPYTAIVIPLGLIQIFKDGTDRFNPSKDAFDPIRAVEDISNPLHFTFGRGTTQTGQAFVSDIVNGKLNSNLLVYKGFNIPTSLAAEGLASPNIGGTIKLFKKGNSYQGVYVGAGPYLGFNTNFGVDQKLADLLNTGTAALCSPCNVTNAAQIQLAMAFTLGYRVKVGTGPDKRDGVYVAYNYHYLKGFKYLDENVGVRIDTNAQGQLKLPPITIPPINPVTISGVEASSGKGYASDIGVQVVRGFFEVGFGVNGIGNQIEWTDFQQKTFTLTALQGGLDFVEKTTPSGVTSLIVKLPVVKTANVGFQVAGWGALASITNGFNGTSFHGGVERQVAGPLWVRGGGRYSRGYWDPTYGFGVGKRVALDVGFYGSHANLEGKRQTAMAVSVRFNHKR